MRSYDETTALARSLGIDFDRQVGGDGTPFYCLCSCGGTTSFGRKGWTSFKPGHDTRLVATLLRRARAGEININEAIEALDHAAGEKLANKLRALWLRVGRK